MGPSSTTTHFTVLASYTTLWTHFQRRLLPAAYSWEPGFFTLAAWLKPAASVVGDTDLANGSPRWSTPAVPARPRP